MTMTFAALLTLLLAALVLDRLRYGRRIVVTTKQGTSIRGVQLPSLRPGVVLGEPEWLEGNPLTLSGRIEVPRENVAMIQDLGERIELRPLPPLQQRPELPE